MTELIGIILLLLGVMGWGVSFFRKKEASLKQEITDIKVKGAENEAKAEVSDKSLPDLVDANNKKYGDGSK